MCVSGQQGGAEATASTVFGAALEVPQPIVFATLTMMLAVTPFFFMGGVAGSFLNALAFSSALARGGVARGRPDRHAVPRTLSLRQIADLPDD